MLCVVRSGLRVLCCSQVLEGNSDKNTERYNYLNAPFVARYVRIYPANWSRHIAMRAGLLGCPQTGDACTDGFYRLSPHTQCSTFLRCCTLHILYTSTRRDEYYSSADGRIPEGTLRERFALFRVVNLFDGRNLKRLSAGLWR